VKERLARYMRHIKPARTSSEVTSAIERYLKARHTSPAGRISTFSPRKLCSYEGVGPVLCDRSLIGCERIHVTVQRKSAESSEGDLKFLGSTPVFSTSIEAGQPYRPSRSSTKRHRITAACCPRSFLTMVSQRCFKIQPVSS
jgi:hypothetical protein